MHIILVSVIVMVKVFHACITGMCKYSYCTEMNCHNKQMSSSVYQVFLLPLLKRLCTKLCSILCHCVQLLIMPSSNRLDLF